MSQTALDQIYPANFILALNHGREKIDAEWAARIQANLAVAREAMTLPVDRLDASYLGALVYMNTLLEAAHGMPGDKDDLSTYKDAQTEIGALLAERKRFVERMGSRKPSALSSVR